jgi:hypothetical protein
VASFWQQSLGWQIFFCCMCGVFASGLMKVSQAQLIRWSAFELRSHGLLPCDDSMLTTDAIGGGSAVGISPSACITHRQLLLLTVSAVSRSIGVSQGP